MFTNSYYMAHLTKYLIIKIDFGTNKSVNSLDAHFFLKLREKFWYMRGDQGKRTYKIYEELAIY